MPAYKFRCDSCKSFFEVIMTITEYINHNLEIKCSKCNSENITRVPTILTVVYKGNGFYSTDSKERKKDEKGISAE